jgi:hypothetical protein
MRAVGKKRIPPAANPEPSEPRLITAPATRARMTAMGMTVNGRKKVVSGFSSRSG